MSRVSMATQSWGVFWDPAGNVQSGLSVLIKNRDGTNATHYSARTAGTSATGSITTDVNGRLTRYIDPGEYTLTVNSVTYDISAAHGGGQSGESVLYVDYTYGDDANDGRGPGVGSAKKTIGSAHTALPSTGGTIFLAGGVHDYTATVTITKCVRLIGAGAGVVTGAAATVLRWTAATEGLVIDAPAQKSRIQDLDLLSLQGGTAAAGRGLVIRAHGVVVDNVIVKQFGSHGVDIDSDATHNANGFDLRSVRCHQNAGDGFHIDGTDSNAGTLYMCDAASNLGWGYFNDGNGNAFWSLQCENNTTGAIQDTGDSSAYIWPYVEGGASLGQNVDLSGATNGWFVSQGFGIPTFTPTPAATNSVWNSGQWLYTDLIVGTAGKGLKVKEGSNAKMGRSTLVAGTVVVSTTAVTATSEVFLTCQTPGGTPGFLRVSARTAATSFTILSSSGTDTSVVGWLIVEPA